MPNNKNVYLNTAFAILFLASPILASFFTPVPTFLYLLSFFGAAFFIFKYPESGLYSAIFLTVIFAHHFTLQSLAIGSESYKIYPLDIVLILTSFSFIFNQARNRKETKFNFCFLDLSIIFFALIVLIYFLASFYTSGVDLAISFSAFKNYSFYAFTYFLITFIITQKKQFSDFISVFQFTTFLLVGFVIAGLIRGEGIWTEYNPLSTEGTRYLSFPHSFYLSLAICLNIPLFFYSVKSAIIPMSLVWVQFVGILSSLMRHIWISLSVGLFYIWFTLYKKEKERWQYFIRKNGGAFLMLASIALLVFWLFPFWEGTSEVKTKSEPLINRVLSFLESPREDPSVNWRLAVWELAQKNFIANPWLGIGFGQSMLLVIGDYREIIFTRDFHNSILVLLINMGLLGFGFFCLINGVVIYYLYKILKEQQEYFPYSVGITGMYIVFLLSSLWQPYFETNFTGIFFWVILGLIRFIAFCHPERSEGSCMRKDSSLRSE